MAMLKVNCLGIAAIQRSMWRQRSMLQWLKEGATSTRFFHSKAYACRHKIHMQRIENDDTVLVTDQFDKEEAIWKYFQNLVGEMRTQQHTHSTCRL
jgi:hypothetical protein